MNTFQVFAICGIISPIIYTAMWILGGKLQADYNTDSRTENRWINRNINGLK